VAREGDRATLGNEWGGPAKSEIGYRGERFRLQSREAVKMSVLTGSHLPVEER